MLHYVTKWPQPTSCPFGFELLDKGPEGPDWGHAVCFIEFGDLGFRVLWARVGEVFPGKSLANCD